MKQAGLGPLEDQFQLQEIKLHFQWMVVLICLLFWSGNDGELLER